MRRRYAPAIVIGLLMLGALLLATGLASIRPTSTSSPIDNAYERLAAFGAPK